jgi:hypothetical protein
MRKLSRAKIVIAAAVATMAGAAGTAGLAIATPASAATATAVYYPLVNDNSGLCMGVTSSDKVGQYTCVKGSANQQWTFVPAADGEFYIKNKSGYCLYTMSLDAHSQVYASPDQCSQTGNFVTWLPNDGPITANADGADVIGIDAGSMKSGAQAIIWPYTGVKNQQWYYDGAPA